MMNPDTTMTTSVQGASSNKGKIVVAVILAAAIGAFFYFDLQQYLSLDALKANRDRLLAEVSGFSAKLGEVRKLLEAGNAAGLEKLFAEARAARDRWIRSS